MISTIIPTCNEESRIHALLAAQARLDGGRTLDGSPGKGEATRPLAD